MAEDAEYGRDLSSKKANQFGRGEPNFNAMAIWLVFLPMMLSVVAYLPASIKYSDEAAVTDGESAMKLRMEGVSYLFGWASVLCLTFFLIPVTRHSVLLAAMGWSPIHALRVHIWFGYMSFVYMLIHGVLLVPVWFLYYDYPVYQQIVPNSKCWTWTWTEETEKDVQPDCVHVFANWTGIVAAVFFTILWGSSLNWVRRTNYRLFYILHVTFGTLTLLGTILHMHWFIIYLLPSITYYLASTAPTLVQAVASRFRGGVKIRKVVLVDDSGGCVEVHLEAHETARAVLDREPCQFIKLCVPNISLVWHPFDVFKSCNTDGKPGDTVRFLFRPVGPFTKELAERLTSNVERPVTLVDGFYLGSDKTELAMQHDCVTMVAGGVALSPYLTLIPALLNRIARADKLGAMKTHSIVLHWVCREPGLCSYYVDNYLNSIVKRARSLNLDVTLSMYVYLTGGKKNASAAELSETSTVDGSSRLAIEGLPAVGFADGSKDETEAVDAESGSSGLDKSSAGRSNDKTEAVDAESGSSGLDKRSEHGKSISDDDKSLSDCQAGDVAIIDLDSPGHPLELARMLPRRHSSWVWNLPFCVFYSGITFFGFWYLFDQDPKEPSSYFDYSKMTWITVYAVLMYFAFGIVSEACVLGLRTYWPEPSPDSFDVLTSPAKKWEEVSDSSDLDDPKKVEEARQPDDDKETLVYLRGRPPRGRARDLHVRPDGPDPHGQGRGFQGELVPGADPLLFVRRAVRDVRAEGCCGFGWKGNERSVEGSTVTKARAFASN
jgi:Ferric reductase like transmembrane component/Ferric reductase NAD binding domain